MGFSRDEVTNAFLNNTTWGVKRIGNGIPYTNHTVTNNFDTLEHFCEVLAASLLNGWGGGGVGGLDIRTYPTQL